MVDMQIKRYEPDQRQAVVRLSLRAWAPVFPGIESSLEPAVYEAFYPNGWEASQAKAVEDVCADPDVEVWIAEEAGAVAGFTALRFHRDDKLGEVYMIAVDPDFQRRGIAAALTDHAVERMKAEGMSVAMVETGGDFGHAPARASYERSGFRLCPVARYFKKL